MTKRAEVLVKAGTAMTALGEALLELAKDSDPSNDTVLTVNEVAKLLKSSVSQVSEELRSRRMSGWRVGRRGWRVNLSDVQAFKRNRANGSHA